MKTFKVVCLVLSTSLVSVAFGFNLKGYFLGPHIATIVLSDFSTRLLEDSAALGMLKQQRIACAQEMLENRITSGIENLDHYRNFQNAEKNDLARLERVAEFGKAQLKLPIEERSKPLKPCNT